MRLSSAWPTGTFDVSSVNSFFQVSILSRLLHRQPGTSAQVNFTDVEEILKNTKIDRIGNSNPELSRHIAPSQPCGGYPAIVRSIFILEGRSKANSAGLPQNTSGSQRRPSSERLRDSLEKAFKRTG